MDDGTSHAAKEPTAQQSPYGVTGEENRLPPSNSSRMLSGWHVAFFISLMLFIGVSAFAAGLIVERSIFRNASPLSVVTGDAPYDQVSEIARLLADEYYFRPDTEAEREAFNQELEYAAVNGMIATLEDPYTTFLPPREAGAAAQHLEGEFGGIGVQIQYIDGRLTVISPIPGSPADRAGIEPGDVILEAGGVPLRDLPPAEAGALIRGPVGTTVELVIKRATGSEPFRLEIIREEIENQVVYLEPIEGISIMHLRVTSFTERTVPQLDAALEQVIAGGATGIVLDLRDNGGGLVSAAQALIGRFVPADAGPAFWEDTGSGDEELLSFPILDGDLDVYGIPMVVLVNEGTASAAEIAAGALRDYDRAKLTGEATFGKGLVQRIWNFDDGSSARITVARWLTPDQSPIPEDGLAVSIPISLMPSTISDDPTAARAARALRSEGWSELQPDW
jgi:carboxyl-terminal processing protease